MFRLRDALRGIRREPRLPLTMVAVLSLAFGAASAVFSLVNALVLKPLPYPHADRLVTASIGARVWSTRMLDAVAATDTVFDKIAGVHERSVTLVGETGADVVRLEAVSTAYFDLLGTRPALGRIWTPADDTAGAAPTSALVSDALWQRRYNGDPAIVGRSIVVDGTRLLVAGVLPPEFRGLIGRTDIWVPLHVANSLGVATPSDRPWSRWFEVIGRVKSNVPPQQAMSMFDADARRAVAVIPGSQAALGTRWRGTLVPLAAARRDPRMALASEVLLGGALFVLALAAVNLAGLHLVRTRGRAREIAIRAAVGARPTDVAAVLLAESATIVAAGALGGVALRNWFLEALLALRPEAATFGLRASDLFEASALRLDARTALALAGAGIVCGAIMSALSLVRARRPALETLARGSGELFSGLGQFGRLGAGSALVALQLALGLIVSAGAGLMARTAHQLWSQDRGVDPSQVLTLRLHPPGARYPPPALGSLHAALEERLSAIPGVEAVSVSNCAPGTGRCRQTNVQSVDGQPLDPARHLTVGVHYVTADHFALLRTPIVRGRAFGDRDAAGATRTVVINESAAARLWPGESPIGRRLSLFFASGADTDEREVVGVVGNVRFDAIEEAPLPDVYVPASQLSWTSTVVFVRSRDGAPMPVAGVRSAVREVDPTLAITEVKSLNERLGAGFATERFLATTLVAFSVAALVLAAIGVYGLASHAVAEGRRECAIRLALGAAPARLFTFIAGRAATIAAVGIGLGTLGAAFATRVLAGFLYGVRPGDPIALGGAVVALAAVTAAAVYLPARRASKLDPSELLRS